LTERNYANRPGEIVRRKMEIDKEMAAELRALRS
jgi:hypothetical protein